MSLPNTEMWLNAFDEMFKDLNTRELAPHAEMLYGQEFVHHHFKGEAWFKCKPCKGIKGKKDRWHSFKAHIEFKYALKKEGKPKKRKGKVTLIPYGQQCKNCADNKSVDDDSLYWMPFFDEAAILNSLADLHIKVEHKFYEEKSAANSNFITHGKTKGQLINETRALALSNNNTLTTSTGRGHSYHNTRRSVRPRTPQQQQQQQQQHFLDAPPADFVYYQDFSGAQVQGYLLPTPIHQQYYQPTVEGDINADGDHRIVPRDDDGESITCEIGNGPHKQELCEACKKGKCMMGNGEDATSNQPSGRQSRSGTEKGKFVRLPKSFDDIPDDVSNKTKNVRWYLTFGNL